MKRNIISAAAAVLFFAALAYGQTLLSGMTEETTPATTDILYVVVNPGVSDGDRKVTIGNAVLAGLSTVTVPDDRWFEVAGMSGSTPVHILDTPTSNVPTPVSDAGSNTHKAVLEFDASTDQSVQHKDRLPTGYSSSSGISYTFRWKAAATSGAVGWCVQLVRVPDGATSDPAFPAQSSSNCVSDTAKGTTLQENEATISNVTCTSCVAGDLIYVRISRDANGSAVTDSLSGNAKLIGFSRRWRKALL